MSYVITLPASENGTADAYDEIIARFGFLAGVDITDPNILANAQYYLYKAIKLVESYLDSKIDSGTVTKTWYNGMGYIYVPQFWVTAVNSITIDGTAKTATNYKVYDGLLYEVNGNCPCLFRNYCEITAEFAYANDPFNESVLDAIVLTTATGYNTHGSGVTTTTGIAEESIAGVGSIKYDTSGNTNTQSTGFYNIPIEAKQLLDLIKPAVVA